MSRGSCQDQHRTTARDCKAKKDLSASEREKAEAKGEVTRLLGEQRLVSAEIAHRGLPARLVKEVHDASVVWRCVHHPRPSFS
jgi:hypothetical protein